MAKLDNGKTVLQELMTHLGLTGTDKLVDLVINIVLSIIVFLIGKWIVIKVARNWQRVVAKMKKDEFWCGVHAEPLSLPPEIKMLWRKRINRISSATAPKIKSILADPKRDGIYHVLYEAKLPESDDIEFRLQFARQKNHYAFLALE